jgi:integrase
MYSTKHRRKAKPGSVQIKLSNGRLQLVFSFGGRRRYISTGLRDTPFNRMQAQQKALEVERDINYGQFDPETLEKYKVGVALSTVEAIDSISKPALDLPELWNRYTEARKTGKSPSTVRMYQWVSNHLDRCSYKLPSEAQAIFDWLGSNVPPDSRQRVLMHLSACCKWSVKSSLIEGNPFEAMAGGVKVPKAGSEEDEIRPFSKVERDRIIEAFRENRYYSRYAPLVEFLFFTGARPSEALALQWKHISKTHITFERALVYSGRGFVVKDGLKTQQERRFPINAQLAALLRSNKLPRRKQRGIHSKRDNCQSACNC